MIQSVVAQALQLGARVVVYRRLSEDEIAIATWSLSASMFLSWLAPPIGDVLVQRQRHFARWANTAFWVTAAASTLALVSGAILAPVFGWWYHSWQVVVLVVLAGATSAFGNLPAVWVAEKTIAFRFRKIAQIAVVGSIITAALTIGMAILRMGAWTMVIPTLIANIAMFVLYVRDSQFRPGKPARLRRAILLIRPSMSLSVGAFFSQLVMQADTFFVGLYQRGSLAPYQMAYALSCQLVQLLSKSLRSVLLTAFSGLQKDAQRREGSYLEALRLACAVSMPVTILPIPAAPLIVLTVFSRKWANATSLFQIFLFGMGFLVVYAIAFTSMQSRGMFRRYLVTNILLGLGFSAIIWPTTARGSVQQVAMTVVTIYVVTSILCAAAASPSSGRHRLNILMSILPPFLIAIAGATAGYFVGQLIPGGVMGYAGAAVSLLAGSAVYGLGALVLMRRTVRTTAARVSDFIAHRRRRQGA
ncbi:MAG: oligosaccharide flippase family protein [Phycisphaerae bacterium]